MTGQSFPSPRAACVDRGRDTGHITGQVQGSHSLLAQHGDRHDLGLRGAGAVRLGGTYPQGCQRSSERFRFHEIINPAVYAPAPSLFTAVPRSMRWCCVGSLWLPSPVLAGALRCSLQAPPPRCSPSTSPGESHTHLWPLLFRTLSYCLSF